MGTVNQTLDNTVAAWNSNFISIAPYAHFNYAFSYSSKIVYRFDRDFGFSLSSSNFSKILTDSYNDAAVSLDLNRSVGATDVMVGIVYYLPPLLYSTEPYAVLEFGAIFARADGSTFRTQTTKNGTVYSTDILTDTAVKYRKSKGILNVSLGATMDMGAGWFIRGELAYKFAKVGQMDGEITRLEGTSYDASFTEFDYSLVAVSLGVGIQL